eukprot:GDKH01026526.1.p1 GENE.GDKH01026526.1~~GDKH01026526.1.p1  ORF type:complete len:178 (-),score=12.80 GDKH01026526.1:138-671(-)
MDEGRVPKRGCDDLEPDDASEVPFSHQKKVCLDDGIERMEDHTAPRGMGFRYRPEPSDHSEPSASSHPHRVAFTQSSVRSEPGGDLAMGEMLTNRHLGEMHWERKARTLRRQLSETGMLKTGIEGEDVEHRVMRYYASKNEMLRQVRPQCSRERDSQMEMSGAPPPGRPPSTDSHTY